MQRIRQIQSGVFEYQCLHFSPQELADPQQIRFMIDRDLMLTGVRKRQFQNALVIMNFLSEAIDAKMAQPLADVLRGLGAQPAGIFMVPLCAGTPLARDMLPRTQARSDQTSPPPVRSLISPAARVARAADYPRVTIPYWCANHSDWFDRFRCVYPEPFDPVTDRRVICLNRRWSPVRDRIVHHLLGHFDPQEILLSHNSLESLQGKSDQMLLDGSVDHVQQHRAPPTSWLRAAVKLITEGNEQHMPNVPDTVLVSEKTFKCFAWHQFPIWVSVPGTVQAVRGMGFDVFDDLFGGHDYDCVLDQDKRIHQVLDIATQFLSRPIPELADLRQHHLSRLQANWRRLMQLAAQRDQDLAQARTRFIKMFVENSRSSV